MSLVPVPEEQTSLTCGNCGAAIVAGQRYCLSCGQPCAPTRLAFLDVIEAERQATAPAGWAANDLGGSLGDGYGPPGERSPLQRWLARYSPLLAVFAVLLLAIVIGLLVGHWVTDRNSTSAKQVVEVKGLPQVVATPATTTQATSTSASANSKSTATEEAEEAKQAKAEEAAPAKAPTKVVKVSPSAIKKLETSTGKQHQEELNKLGNEPIETGG